MSSATVADVFYRLFVTAIFIVVALLLLFPSNRFLPLDRRLACVWGAALCSLIMYCFGQPYNPLSFVDVDVLLVLSAIMIINFMLLRHPWLSWIIERIQYYIQTDVDKGFYLVSIMAFFTSQVIMNDGVCLMLVYPVLDAFIPLSSVSSFSGEKSNQQTKKQADPAGGILTDSSQKLISQSQGKVVDERANSETSSASSSSASSFHRYDSFYFMLNIACSANIGSVMTYAGNPQNLIIAQYLSAYMNCAVYYLYMALPAVVTWILTLGYINYCRKRTIQKLKEESGISRSERQSSYYDLLTTASADEESSTAAAKGKHRKRKVTFQLTTVITSPTNDGDGEREEVSSPLAKEMESGLMEGKEVEDGSDVEKGSSKREKVKRKTRAREKSSELSELDSPPGYHNQKLLVLAAKDSMREEEDDEGSGRQRISQAGIILPCSLFYICFACLILSILFVSLLHSFSLFLIDQLEDDNNEFVFVRVPKKSPFFPQLSFHPFSFYSFRHRFSSLSFEGQHLIFPFLLLTLIIFEFIGILPLTGLFIIIAINMLGCYLLFDYYLSTTNNNTKDIKKKISEINIFIEAFFITSFDYNLLIIFFGLFIVSGSFLTTTIPSYFWNIMVGKNAFQNNLSIFIISIYIIIFSQLVGNVPLVYLAKEEIVLLDRKPQIFGWLILAYVSTIAGNVTLVGSAANIIVVEKAMRLVNVPCLVLVVVQLVFVGFRLLLFVYFFFSFRES
jgi:Na+/H+ antiporter NhaD/arsenite permease-like protein